ncbi:hypothetical protein R4K55_08835 [Brachyspira alvinipulli]|uniref:hypothetical protein n=1 Tax=Brachyspira alvinipulli TaxID=84379 RepID=UPI00262D4186|nr:hypothetical protein [uncultured Brachyspira sp.]
MVEKIKNFYNTKKKLFFLIIILWLLLTVSLGVLIGSCSKPKVIPLTPEEENSKAINNMKEDEEKIIKGEMLSTKDNLTFEELEYSRNYTENRKK